MCVSTECTALVSSQTIISGVGVTQHYREVDGQEPSLYTSVLPHLHPLPSFKLLIAGSVQVELFTYDPNEIVQIFCKPV